MTLVRRASHGLTAVLSTLSCPGAGLPVLPGSPALAALGEFRRPGPGSRSTTSPAAGPGAVGGPRGGRCQGPGRLRPLVPAPGRCRRDLLSPAGRLVLARPRARPPRRLPLQGLQQDHAWLRTPGQADRWTRVVIAAHAQLLLAAAGRRPAPALGREARPRQAAVSGPRPPGVPRHPPPARYPGPCPETSPPRARQAQRQRQRTSRPSPSPR
jgi:hypothetical protein